MPTENSVDEKLFSYNANENKPCFGTRRRNARQERQDCAKSAKAPTYDEHPLLQVLGAPGARLGDLGEHLVDACPNTTKFSWNEETDVSDDALSRESADDRGLGQV
jgi:hypothetical protein